MSSPKGRETPLDADSSNHFRTLPHSNFVNWRRRRRRSKFLSDWYEASKLQSGLWSLFPICPARLMHFGISESTSTSCACSAQKRDHECDSPPPLKIFSLKKTLFRCCASFKSRADAQLLTEALTELFQQTFRMQKRIAQRQGVTKLLTLWKEGVIRELGQISRDRRLPNKGARDSWVGHYA